MGRLLNKMLDLYTKKVLYYIIWFNLFIGLYNLYLYSIENLLFNLMVGSLNIGVWVFYRKIYD